MVDEAPHVINLDDLKELQSILAFADIEEEARERKASMNKVKILCLSIWYPLSMSRYFERAMRRNPMIDLKTVGPFTGSWIPWLGGMNLPEKYAKPPDHPLGVPPNVGRVDYEWAISKLQEIFPEWTPDLVVSIDAGITWNSRPKHGISATIATDPHCLDYDHQRRISDKFFNMQKCYSEPKDIYLPYAYDPTVHYPEDTERDLDAVLIGMPYGQRVEWIDQLRKHGVSVHTENGPVFDEYRKFANRANIGLNWSSLNDLNARFFETPAFGLCQVANRVPDAPLFLKEDEEYLAFSTLPEAVEKTVWAKNNPDKARDIAWKARAKIQPHTYDERVRQVLTECGFTL